MSKTTNTNKIETDTWAHKTIEAWKDAAREAGIVLEYPDDFPNNAAGQLERLKKLNAIGNGQHTKTVTHMFRQLVNTVDKNGKPVTKEYLTYMGHFGVTNHRGLEYGMEFEIGKYLKPNVVTNSNQRYDPETGQPKYNEKVLAGQKLVYDLELPKDAAKRKKLIDEIIGDSYHDNIHFYYRELGAENMPFARKRDGTFSYEDFVNCSIEELRNMSAKGGGSRSLGYYRDKDNKLRDRNDILI